MCTVTIDNARWVVRTLLRRRVSADLVSAVLAAVLIGGLAAGCSASLPAHRFSEDPAIRQMRWVEVPPGTFWMGSHHASEKACDEGKPPAGVGVDPAEVDTYCRLHGPKTWFVDEQPRHRVTIDRGFWMSATEVTVAQFRAFVDDTGYRTTAELSGRSLGESTTPEALEVYHAAPGASWRRPLGSPGLVDDHPVTHVSWRDATAFCDWLSRRTGETYRLPTEAEWEWAALGGLEPAPAGNYSWGEAEPRDEPRGNIADRRFQSRYPRWKYPVAGGHDDGAATAAPVGTYPPNGYGLFDLTGNVWEWTADIYSATAYADRNCGRPPAPPCRDPRIGPQDRTGDPPEVVFHTLRGGSFDFELPFQRIQKRRSLAFVYGQEGISSSISVGFRVVRVPGG